MIKIYLSAAFIFISINFSSAAIKNQGVGTWVLHNLFLVASTVVILTAVFSILILSIDLLIKRKNDRIYELGINLASEESAPQATLWEKLTDKSWKIVPIAQEASIDLNHNYDGIRELDNKLPPWWVALFYLCIAFSAVYLYIYHFSGNGWSSRSEYAMVMEKASLEREELMAKLANAVNETSVVTLTDENDLAKGKKIYIGRCASCHGQLGEGLVGPNLTDDYWLHGGGIRDIFKTVKYGVPNKGMIAWKTQINPVKIQQVSSYLMTLVGTNPPNQKEKQGKLFVPSEDDK